MAITWVRGFDPCLCEIAHPTQGLSVQVRNDSDARTSGTNRCYGLVPTAGVSPGHDTTGFVRRPYREQHGVAEHPARWHGLDGFLRAERTEGSRVCDPLEPGGDIVHRPARQVLENQVEVPFSLSASSRIGPGTFSHLDSWHDSLFALSQDNEVLLETNTAALKVDFIIPSSWTLTAAQFKCTA